MIRVNCPNCGAKLDAKDELGGETRKCPKCGEPVLIAPSRAEEGAGEEAPMKPPPPPGGDASTPAGPKAAVVGDVPREPPPSLHEGGPTPALFGEPVAGTPLEPVPVDLEPLERPLWPFEPLERLKASSRYLICGRDRIMATWQGNGHGWMLKAGAGFVRAAHSPGDIPSQGEFTLIELRMAESDQGLRLRGVATFQLATRWSLTVLPRGDNPILGKITGPGALNREQKNLVRTYLRGQFMHDVWHDSEEVVEYLTNDDYRSPGAGELE